MLYRKNIYQWEQALRIAAGIAATAAGFAWLAAPWSYVGAGMGLVTALTGVLGWCPACAMVGRRLEHRQ